MHRMKSDAHTAMVTSLAVVNRVTLAAASVVRKFFISDNDLLTLQSLTVYDLITGGINVSVNSQRFHQAGSALSGVRNASGLGLKQRGTLDLGIGQSDPCTEHFFSASYGKPQSRPRASKLLGGVSLGLAAKAMHQRLRPVEFRAAIYAKGWKFNALAAFWGVTNVTLCRWASDECRPAYLDDAVRGLRAIGPALPLPKSWQAELSFARPQRPPAKRAGRPPSKLGPGFRYRGYMVLGAVVAVSKDLGSMATEGQYGVVVQIVVDEERESYRVIFQTGCIEQFDADLVDAYLVTTGLENDELSQYRYVSDEALLTDFEAGLFTQVFIQ